MTGTTLPSLRVLGTRVSFGLLYQNSEFMHRALTRWKSLEDNTRGTESRSTAPFLGRGEIMGGICYVIQPGHLILEVAKDDDALAATMLALAADILENGNSDSVTSCEIGRSFAIPSPGSGPLTSIFDQFPNLTLNGAIPDTPQIEFRYIIDDTTIKISVQESKLRWRPSDFGNRLWISARVEPIERLDAPGMVNFLRAWPNHRTMMLHAVEHVLGIDHER